MIYPGFAPKKNMGWEGGTTDDARLTRIGNC